jgi:hypothetical protein
LGSSGVLYLSKEDVASSARSSRPSSILITFSHTHEGPTLPSPQGMSPFCCGAGKGHLLFPSSVAIDARTRSSSAGGWCGSTVATSPVSEGGGVATAADCRRLSLPTTASPCFLLRYAESSKKSQQSQHYPWPRQRTLPKTRVTRETTGIYESRVLTSGIRSSRFDSDTTYEYKVFFRLYSTVIKEAMRTQSTLQP